METHIESKNHTQFKSESQIPHPLLDPAVWVSEANLGHLHEGHWWHVGNFPYELAFGTKNPFVDAGLSQV